MFLHLDFSNFTSDGLHLDFNEVLVLIIWWLYANSTVLGAKFKIGVIAIHVKYAVDRVVEVNFLWMNKIASCACVSCLD